MELFSCFLNLINWFVLKRVLVILLGRSTECSHSVGRGIGCSLLHPEARHGDPGEWSYWRYSANIVVLEAIIITMFRVLERTNSVDHMAPLVESH